MYKKINLQYVLSYLGLFPFLIILFDKFFFESLDYNKVNDFSIFYSIIISTLFWSDFKNPYIWILIFITISFGAIGFLDDWLKIKEKNSKGLKGKYKLILQFIFALIAMLFMLQVSPAGNEQIFILPFNKGFIFEISPFI